MSVGIVKIILVGRITWRESYASRTLKSVALFVFTLDEVIF